MILHSGELSVKQLLKFGISSIKLCLISTIIISTRSLIHQNRRSLNWSNLIWTKVRTAKAYHRLAIKTIKIKTIKRMRLSLKHLKKVIKDKPISKLLLIISNNPSRKSRNKRTKIVWKINKYKNGFHFMTILISIIGEEL